MKTEDFFTFIFILVCRLSIIFSPFVSWGVLNNIAAGYEFFLWVMTPIVILVHLLLSVSEMKALAKRDAKAYNILLKFANNSNKGKPPFISVIRVLGYIALPITVFVLNDWSLSVVLVLGMIFGPALKQNCKEISESMSPIDEK